MKDAVLDDNDDLWVELRHTFIADVFKTTSQRMTEMAATKAAKLAGGVSSCARRCWHAGWPALVRT
jgi:hypothetical protein